MPNPSPSTPQPEGDQATRVKDQDLRGRVVAELVPKVQSLRLDDEGQILHLNGSAPQPRGYQPTTWGYSGNSGCSAVGGCGRNFCRRAECRGVPLVKKLQSLNLVNDGQVAENVEMLLLAKVRVTLGFMLKHMDRLSKSEALAEPVRILRQCEAMLTQPTKELKGEDQVTLLKTITELFCKANNLFITYRDGTYIGNLDGWKFLGTMMEDMMWLHIELVSQPDTALKKMEMMELLNLFGYAFSAGLSLQPVLPALNHEDDENGEGFVDDELFNEDEEDDELFE